MLCQAILRNLFHDIWRAFTPAVIDSNHQEKKIHKPRTKSESVGVFLDPPTITL